MEISTTTGVDDFTTLSTTTDINYQTDSTISPFLSLFINSTSTSQTANIFTSDPNDRTTMPPTTTTESTTTNFVSNLLLNSNWVNNNNSSKQVYDEDSNAFIECWNRSQFQIPELHHLPTPIIVLMVIAIIFLVWAAIKFIQALWTFFFCYLLGYGAKWCPGPDSWAIITGSTDGIGLAYAKAMAKKGYCLFLLSRNQQKLDKVKAEILNQFPDCPQVKILAVDFTLDDIYPKIAEEIRALNGHVHVLINNVGMAYKYPEYFTKILNSDKFISDILNCNILSVTRMTHIVLPMMEARRSGIIINVSSYSALFPTPLLAMYSASKIYMDYFSRALHYEYGDRGIVVQSVLPYYVSTNMIRNPGISLMIPSADQFVKSALKTVGVESRTYGYFAHNVLAFFQSFIVKFVIGNNLNTQIAFFRMKRFRKGCYKRKGLKHNV